MADKPDEDEDLIIEAEPLPEEEAPPEVIKAEEEPKPEPEAIDPEKGLAELKAKLDASETARAQDVRRAQEAEQRAAQAQGSAQETEVSLVETAISTTKTNLDRAEQDYAQALTDQDYAAAAKIQRSIGTESARLLQLENGLEQMKARPKPQAQPINDPVEALASQLDPRSAQWIRQHPQYARDNNLYAQMIAAHNLAMGRGQTAGSDSYFQTVENLLGLQAESAPIVAEERRQVPPASAPVSRGANGVASKPNTVRLSADEREMAHINFPELDEKAAEREYGRQKLLIEAEKGQMQ